MHVQDSGTARNAAELRTPPGASPRRGEPAPSRLLLALQGSAGNGAVVHLLRRSGHAGAEERHQHGAGCGHTSGAAVQRSAVQDVLGTPGRALDEATRSDMESRLGADFSDVRIHTDAAARASAAEVGARAYTSGSHVVIGDGGADRHTLAHELTHVIQQRQGPVAGTDNGSGLKVSDPADRFEREAEANATRAMSGAAPQVQRAETPKHTHGGATAIQRVSGGGHAQGDHVFNALDNTAATIGTALKQRARDVGAEIDDDVKEGNQEDPAALGEVHP
ncbi:eCIS core domain-containing protein [Streptomyces sp. HUAS TT7]|uniref:eCIS core domain-containing protein n=1 Tax=Streptomyces sp. HUAS TT7 TaxID=3447507 RepID=UPI003F65E25D